MTVRDRIVRRVLQAFGFLAAYFLALVLLAEILPAWKAGPIAVLAMLVGFALPFAWLQAWAGCARCDYPLMLLFGFWRLKWGARRKRIHFCPHCRLPLDTPVADVVAVAKASRTDP